MNFFIQMTKVRVIERLRHVNLRYSPTLRFRNQSAAFALFGSFVRVRRRDGRDDGCLSRVRQ